jgi:cell division protein FtsL
MASRAVTSLTFQRWLRILAGIITVLMLMVWEHVEALHLQRQLKLLHKEEDRWVFQNAQMQMQINQLESPSRLENVAKTQLGMVPLDARHVIAVEQP